ncbi:MAG: tetratricopeptide repeat protein [Planctomycetaceae bacterium]|jgi:tetratricopeptide (TPR) repeat protein
MGVSFPPEVEGLIQAIERDHFVRPEAVLGPLRQLLQRCADRDQIAYVCEKLGFAHLRLGEHQMSRIYYEHALRLQPGNFYILANLAHALFELGDRAEGVDHGRRALLLKDQSVMAAVQVVWRSRMAEASA